MRRTLSLITLALLISPASAIEGPSIQTGKRLFESRHLGSSGKSCTSCHPEGMKLEGSSGQNPDQLVSAVNRCIEQSVLGAPLDRSSTEMSSIVLYVRSLSPGSRAQ